jgi:GT2 family glycosyltransferase
MTTPGISLIIPTYNRPDRLSECLEALCALKPASFEVLIVDDGSVPPVESVVTRFAGRLPVRYFRQDNAGPASARNTGAAQARGRILVFTDDDCRPEADWLNELTAAVEAAPDALVGGRTRNALTGNIHSEASQDLVSFLYDHALAAPEGFDFFTSNNMACLKSAFVALGGFDETFPLAAGEDRDFGLRWKRSGGRLIYVETAVMDHYHALSWRKFWRQQSNYGRGARHLRQRFKVRQERPVPFAGLRFYTGMLTFPFHNRQPRPFFRSLLLVMSQVAMTAGFVADWWRDRTGMKQHG